MAISLSPRAPLLQSSLRPDEGGSNDMLVLNLVRDIVGEALGD